MKENGRRSLSEPAGLEVVASIALQGIGLNRGLERHRAGSERRQTCVFERAGTCAPIRTSWCMADARRRLGIHGRNAVDCSVLSARLTTHLDSRVSS